MNIENLGISTLPQDEVAKRAEELGLKISEEGSRRDDLVNIFRIPGVKDIVTFESLDQLTEEELLGKLRDAQINVSAEAKDLIHRIYNPEAK